MPSLRLDILPKNAQKEVQDFYEFLIAKYNASNKTKLKRPFGLAEGEFTVPEDFNDPLPNVITDTFYN